MDELPVTVLRQLTNIELLMLDEDPDKKTVCNALQSAFETTSDHESFQTESEQLFDILAAVMEKSDDPPWPELAKRIEDVMQSIIKREDVVMPPKILTDEISIFDQDEIDGFSNGASDILSGASPPLISMSSPSLANQPAFVDEGPDLDEWSEEEVWRFDARTFFSISMAIAAMLILGSIAWVNWSSSSVDAANVLASLEPVAESTDTPEQEVEVAEEILEVAQVATPDPAPQKTSKALSCSGPLVQAIPGGVLIPFAEVNGNVHFYAMHNTRRAKGSRACEFASGPNEGKRVPSSCLRSQTQAPCPEFDRI